MNPPAIEIRDLTRRYGKFEAVQGLNLTVARGRCYGFFGRNGSGKTTTIKCLLNLLAPHGGDIRVFGHNPQREEIAVKSRLSYVPDTVAFYPWMSVRDALDYFASFRTHWNIEIEKELLERFRLSPGQRTVSLSKGQKTQVALIAAICPEPELLVLDEPTSGLDPIVRREFIETVIGAYQAGDPENRTVFVSTHLISEFEGLIDEFTIIDGGKAILTMEADEARARFKKIHVRLPTPIPDLDLPEALRVKAFGSRLEILANGSSEALIERLKAYHPEEIRVEPLTLEEIFVSSQTLGEKRS